MAPVDAGQDPWQLVDIYRERYRIDALLEPVDSLDRSIERRSIRRAGLLRTVSDLRKQLQEVETELAAVEAEIEGSRQAAALLIEDILDRVRIDQGEAWSPTPITGFRVWRLDSGRVLGSQVPWRSPTLESRCLQDVPGEDVPHSVDRCGPPACGIYAVKDLSMFPDDVANSQINHTLVGVVAMSGKVVEHTAGYRARRARVVAVSAYDDGRRLLTDHLGEIDRLFDDPETCLAEAEALPQPSYEECRRFLETVNLESQKWT